VKRVAIIGFGALGKQLLSLLSEGRDGLNVLRFDDILYSRRAENCYPFESYADPSFADCQFYIGLGYKHLVRRAAVVTQLVGLGRDVPSWRHPSCHVHPGSLVGPGCVLYPLCNIGPDVTIQEGVLLNNSVIVSHGCRVGAGAYLSPGVVLSGDVSIGASTFVGSGVVISNGRTVGERARIGIGSVVTIDVPDDGSVIGNPARLLSRPLNLD
jgi:sugar O-acyltransferase (sialic acid O-acetyltransferase NeuD family)